MSFFRSTPTVGGFPPQTTKRPVTYVYLTSAPHSGSTLIACLLAAHPSVSTVGEFGSMFPESGRCSCGTTYAACPFWRAWQAAAGEVGLDFKIGNTGINLQPTKKDGVVGAAFCHLFPWKPVDTLRNALFTCATGWPQHANAVIHRVGCLVQLLCDLESTSVFVDTTKNALQIPFLVRKLPFRLKVVALVRDGRGVMNSLMQKENWSAERSVSTWLYANRNIERALRYLGPDDVFRLRLEDLCQDPRETFDSLLRFCGLCTDAAFDYADRSRRHIVGNSMRHRFDGDIRHDSQWRYSLSAEMQNYFESRAGKLNRKFGYTH